MPQMMSTASCPPRLPEARPARAHRIAGPVSRPRAPMSFDIKNFGDADKKLIKKLSAAGKFDGALEDLERALELEPKDKKAREALAECSYIEIEMHATHTEAPADPPAAGARGPRRVPPAQGGRDAEAAAAAGARGRRGGVEQP